MIEDHYVSNFIRQQDNEQDSRSDLQGKLLDAKHICPAGREELKSCSSLLQLGQTHFVTADFLPKVRFIYLTVRVIFAPGRYVYAVRLMFVSFDVNICRSIYRYRFNRYLCEFDVKVEVRLVFVQVRCICMGFDLCPYGSICICVMAIYMYAALFICRRSILLNEFLIVLSVTVRHSDY